MIAEERDAAARAKEKVVIEAVGAYLAPESKATFAVIRDAYADLVLFRKECVRAAEVQREPVPSCWGGGAE